METWLHPEDQAWMDGCDFHKFGYKTVFHNRKSPGGRLAIVYKDHYQCLDIVTTSLSTGTMEILSCRMQAGSLLFHPVLVYRPPNIPTKTFQKFMDQITNLVDLHLGKRNLLILGDFNFHFNNKTDMEAMVFKDMMEALGFDQHIYFSTQNKGNMLDLVFSEHLAAVPVYNLDQGPFFSDHCVVLFQFGDDTSPPPCHKKILTRDLNSIPLQEFGNLAAMLDTLDPEDDVHSMTTNFENILSTLLDVFAPAKMWMTSVSYNPWFTSKTNLLKQKVRKCEKQWKQNPTDEHWLIFTAHRREYFYAIRHAKKDVLKDRIVKCGKDSRRLFQLVHSLIGTKKNNPLPASPSDKILANTFSEFFFNKISKICQDLDYHPMFDPP